MIYRNMKEILPSISQRFHIIVILDLETIVKTIECSFPNLLKNFWCTEISHNSFSKKPSYQRIVPMVVLLYSDAILIIF